MDSSGGRALSHLTKGLDLYFNPTIFHLLWNQFQSLLPKLRYIYIIYNLHNLCMTHMPKPSYISNLIPFVSSASFKKPSERPEGVNGESHKGFPWGQMRRLSTVRHAKALHGERREDCSLGSRCELCEGCP